MLRRRQALGVAIAAAVSGSVMMERTHGVDFFGPLGPASIPSSLPSAPPPRVDAPERDREASVPQQLRPTAAWWRETMCPVFTPEKRFKEKLRVTREVFREVLLKIQSHPVFDVPLNVGGRKVPVAKQLVCFLLRVGANDPVHEIREKVHVSESTVTTSVRRVAEAICSRLGFYVRTPLNGTEAKAKIARMFAEREPAFKDARGIVDCTHTFMAPETKETRAGNKAAYIGRDGKTTLTWQAIVTPEATPRFLSLSGGIGGAAYDTRVLQKSGVYLHMGRYLEGNEYLCGDCGYALRPWMMRGWAPSELKADDPKTKDRRAFNRLYSGMRISVERAFGILKARFRALGGKLFVRSKKDYRSCMMACCILHNICAERKGNVSAA